VLVILSVFGILLLNYALFTGDRPKTLMEEYTNEELEQLVQYIEAHTRRQLRIQRGLPVDDPNCDPNNYSLSPRLARAPLAAKKHLCMLALYFNIVKRERLDDPNGREITFFMRSDACVPE
jgi:hypothetical protein